MAAARTPTRREWRSSTAVGTSARTTLRTRHGETQKDHTATELVNGSNGDPIVEDNADNANTTVTSRRKAGMPSAARKRKADEISDDELMRPTSPVAEEMIVVEMSTRSSGRARRKTTKLVEEEEWVKQRKAQPKGRKNSAMGETSSGPGEASENEEEVHPDPIVESDHARPINEDEPEPDATPSRKRRGRKSSSQKTIKPTTTVVEVSQPNTGQDAPIAVEGEPPAELTTPSTAPRRRGRPKGSKNRKTANAITDPPFEDISVNPKAKSRKLPNHARPTPTVADSANDEELEELIANNQDLTQEKPQSDRAPAPDGIPTPVAPDEPQPAYNELTKLLSKATHAKSFHPLRHEILLRLTGRKRTPLVGVEREYEQVRSLVEQTVAAGEGNSMLVIGNRGVGKTTLVETALEDVASSHADDFYVIRLTGFVHTDDKLALREIWRQLGQQMQLSEADQATRSNYADTLASLLAVLSHPAEITGEVTTAQTSKSVIFVLDDFDLFAAHPRQTLLYNLFDIAQSRKAPIAVLGLTTKIDVAEALEKRVKSRFSHRYVHLPLPRNYTAFLAIIQAALHCLPEPEFAPPSTAPSSSTLLPTDKDHSTLLRAWTAYISSAIHMEPLAGELRRIYATSKSIPTVLTSLYPALACSSAASPPTTSSLTSHLRTLSPPDSKLTLLPSLSDAQLALLICAARCDAILASDAVNFLLAHDEYVRCTTRARVAAGVSTGIIKSGGGGVPLAAPGLPRAWSRDVCLAAWEGLVNKALLVPVLGTDQGMGGRLASAVGGAGDAGKRGRLWRVDVSLEEIGRAIQGWGGPAREMLRWCKTL